jgi:hypothetical protein
MEKREVLVLGYREVNFTNEETGEVIKGTNVFYIDHKNKTETGYEPARAFIRDKDAVKDVLENKTGIYELELKVELRGNRPMLLVEGFKFVKSHDLIKVV